MTRPVHLFVETLGVIGFIGWLAVGVLLGIWAADREPPRTDMSGDLLTDEPLVPGQRAAVAYRMTITRDCPATVYRRVIAHGATDLLPPVETSPESYIPGDQRVPYRAEVVSHFTVPETAITGDAVYSVTAHYRCNPLHWFYPIRIDWAPVRFEVVRR